jgi:hypothetical protein
MQFGEVRPRRVRRGLTSNTNTKFKLQSGIDGLLDTFHAFGVGQS